MQSAPMAGVHDKENRMNRRVFVCAVSLALAIGLLATAPAFAKPKKGPAPSGSVRIEKTSVGLGIGGTWGGGTLTYKGKKYPFEVDGLDVGGIGFSKTSLNGSVYNLKNLADFNGTYASVGASATVGGGGSVSTMQNQNGVKIRMGGTSEGLRFKAGMDGLKLQLKD